MHEQPGYAVSNLKLPDYQFNHLLLYRYDIDMFSHIALFMGWLSFAVICRDRYRIRLPGI